MEERFALLIDADNVSAKYIKPILDELSKYGNVTYKRIYGDWTRPNSAGWKEELLQNSITPIQQFSYTYGKNATDSAMIIDAMDMLYASELEGFCLVSSDSDFTRLASRLRESGKRVIGNKSASGTEIIEELGEEEINTGAMIVYTSADSVMQICGNEETFDLANLYRCCEIARELTMKDEWRVGRVIARPYVGKKKGEFKRTSNRHDYALKPTGRTALNALKDAGFDVIGVGKINDIFCGEGITKTYHSDSSVHGMQQTVEICKEDFHGLCFVNLVDFDALWGHRRNPEGYGHEIEKFDKGLGNLMNEMREDDLLILTADHGNDPTYTGTDHTREYVPFLAYSKKMKETGAIEDQDTFAVIGASVAENFGVKMPEGTIGKSILEKLK